jgi:hypothetical protein
MPLGAGQLHAISPLEGGDGAWQDLVAWVEYFDSNLDMDEQCASP